MEAAIQKQLIKLERTTLTLEEAAADLGVSMNTMYTLIRREDFPCFRIGKRYRIPYDGLKEWSARMATQHAEVAI